MQALQEAVKAFAPIMFLNNREQQRWDVKRLGWQGRMRGCGANERFSFMPFPLAWSTSRLAGSPGSLSGFN